MESLLDLFFGGDKKASLYVRAVFPSGNFSENSFPSEGSIKNTFLEQLMNPANYKDSSRQTGGVHDDFLNVIRNAGVYHYSLNARVPGGYKQYLRGSKSQAVNPTGTLMAATQVEQPTQPLQKQNGGADAIEILKAYASGMDDYTSEFYKEFVQVLMEAGEAGRRGYIKGENKGFYFNLTDDEIARLGSDSILSGDLAPIFIIIDDEKFANTIPVYNVNGNPLSKFYLDNYETSSFAGLENFGLNWPVFLKNLHKASEAECQCKEESQHTPSCNPCSDGLPDYNFTDFAYGKVWYYDEKDCVYYQIVNGKRINYDEELANETNCYGTYLKKCEKGKCQSIIECIASSNAKGMKDCIAILKDKDLWNVAQEDIAKTDPKIVVDILNKFKIGSRVVKDDNGMDYRVLMTFEEWVTCDDSNWGLKRLDAQAQKFINDNENLKTYLKGIIAFCRANPVIINKREPRISREGFGASGKTHFIERLGKRDYMDPREKSNTYGILATQLRSMPYETFLPAMLPRGLAGMHNLSLMDYRPGRMLGAAVGGAHATFQQNGGNPFKNGPTPLTNGSANLFEDVFKTIKYGLAELGLRLSPADEKSIRCAIDKIRELENKLVQLVKRYSMAIRMGNSINANCYRVDREKLSEIGFKDINDEQSARAFMRSHADSLEKTYGALHGHYANLCSSLTSQVFPRCLDMCCEDKEKRETTPKSNPVTYVGYSDKQ